jgi:alpha 1,6-mannosyltransferase
MLGFRYMALLLEGGIYTDSDTAPVIPADQWGIPYQNASDTLLSHFTRILALPTASTPLRETAGQEANHEDGDELDPPSLVVSIESDAIDFGWYNWREVGLIRALQIVQWTIMVS